MNSEVRIEKLEYNVENLKEAVTDLKGSVAQLNRDVTELRVDTAAIKAQLPNFATHADMLRLTLWMAGIAITSISSIILGILNYLK